MRSLQLAAMLLLNVESFTSTPPRTGHRQRLYSTSPKSDPVAQDALEKTAARLEKLQRRHAEIVSDDDDKLQRLYRQYLLQPANALKEQLKSRKLPRNGRKPDLARRLAQDDLQMARNGNDDHHEKVRPSGTTSALLNNRAADPATRLSSFAGLRLTATAGEALGRAGFDAPSPIQAAAIPRLAAGESLILHAETGSGKVRCLRV